MAHFFKGWRRKVGVFTLILATAFGAGWVRSLTTQDVIFLHLGQNQISLVSTEQLVYWRRDYIQGLEKKWTSPDLMTGPTSNPNPIDEHEKSIFWRCRWRGFGLYDCVLEDEGTRTVLWVFPWWSLVVPLTVITALLLLAKPRKPRRLDHRTTCNSAAAKAPGLPEQSRL